MTDTLRYYVEAGNHGLWLVRDRNRKAYMRAFNERAVAERFASVRNAGAGSRRIRGRIEAILRGDASRFISQRNYAEGTGFIVYDRLLSRTETAFNTEAAADHYARRLSLDFIATLPKEDTHMNTKYAPDNHSTFYVYQRKNGTGFERTGFSLYGEVSEEGAKRVLSAFLKSYNLAQGEFLVQSPSTCWTFVVVPPVPSESTITVV